jgi:hypothetical protein
MTTNRVGGVNPGEPGKGSDGRLEGQHRKVEKIEKVRSIDETENEQTRKKFQSFMSDEEPDTQPKAPSPFESVFTGGSPLEDIKQDSVPSPSYSPPPDLSSEPEKENRNQPLPKSHTFWSKADSSQKAPPDKPPYQEKKKEKEMIAMKESLFSPKDSSKTKLQKEKNKEQTKLSSQRKKTDDVQIQGQVALPDPTEKHLTKKPETTSLAKREKEGVLAHLTQDSEKTFHSKKQDKEREEDQEKKKSSNIIIETPSQINLPSHIIPLAQVATTDATPYLNPQIAPLFFQMVGTIYILTGQQGVSKTEILLNAPSFAQSKFFGATISIEKYATAPDSLNIRLTGTNEAVNTFNQNLPNLYAAFQNGNFAFKIGRITAEYSVEKPIFRRKESLSGGSKDSDNDFTDERGQK